MVELVISARSRGSDRKGGEEGEGNILFLNSHGYMAIKKKIINMINIKIGTWHTDRGGEILCQSSSTDLRLRIYGNTATFHR